MHRHRNISVVGQEQHYVVGIKEARRAAWGLETALAAEKCALVMAQSVTNKRR